jgi:hypothetical protein
MHADSALLIRTTAVDGTAALVTVVTASLFIFFKLHPLLVLAGAALAGAIGLVG